MRLLSTLIIAATLAAIALGFPAEITARELLAAPFLAALMVMLCIKD